MKTVAEKTFRETFDSLASVYGKDGIQDAIKEAGISIEKADQMARDPELSSVLLRALKVDKGKPSLSPSGSINSASLNNRKPQSPFEGKDTLSTDDIIEALRRSRQ